MPNRTVEELDRLIAALKTDVQALEMAKRVALRYETDDADNEIGEPLDAVDRLRKVVIPVEEDLEAIFNGAWHIWVKRLLSDGRARSAKDIAEHLATKGHEVSYGTLIKQLDRMVKRNEIQRPSRGQFVGNQVEAKTA